MIERIWVVFNKEVVDNLRDRKTLAAALLYPLLGPFMMLLLFTVIGNTLATQSEKPLALPVVGRENAPALVQFLQQNGASIQPGPADPEGEVKAGNQDVVLVIPSNYGKEFSSGQPAPVRLIADESRQSASVSIRRAKVLLGQYSAQIGRLRLLVRGVDPAVVDALAIEETDVATPQSQAAMFLNILPYFIIFSVFIGGMYLVIDTIAGERERGSLEPLLTNPVARSEFLLGKLAATIVFAVFSVVETILGFYVMLNIIPTESFGVQVSMSLEAMALIFLIALPMLILASALQMIIATFTKSFKEAQNYLGLLPLIPALPGMVLVFLPLRVQLWMMLIPTFAQQLLISQVMRGEALDSLHVAISTAVTLIAGLVLVAVAIKMYEREQVLVGR
jgi:sodium transport system permease protein